MVAIGWQLYELTGNPFDLGLVGLAQFVPMFLVSPIAGFVADTFDRRRIVTVCQFLGACCALMLALGASSGWLGRLQILCIISTLGGVRAFEFPTMSSMVPLLVERSQLSRAVSLYSSANQIAVVLGPAIGGLLTSLHPGYAYAAGVALFLIAAMLSMSIGATGQVRGKARLSFEALSAGARFIGRSHDILGAITLDVMATGLGSLVAILPAFARDVLHAGPSSLGLLRASPAIGALTMAFLLARYPIRSNAGAKMFGGVLIFGAMVIAFGLSQSLPFALIALAGMGAADVGSVVVRQSLVQLRTPDDMRGRVGSVNSMCVLASNQLGDFRAGSMAGLLGLKAAVLLGGISAIAVALTWMALFPQLRRLQRLDT